MSRSLEELLGQANDVDALDLRARLQWLEDAAAAAEALDVDGALGDEGRDGVLHLRAALGAVVVWSQGPDTTSKESAAQLEALLRTLIARGLVGLYRALASTWDTLAKERAPHRTACIDVRDAFREAAKAIERGEGAPASVREKLESARAALGDAKGVNQ